MTKRTYFLLKKLKMIRYKIIVFIVFPMLLSTFSLADMRVNRFFSFIMLASTIPIEDVKVNQLISMEARQRIVADVTTDKKAFDDAPIQFTADQIGGDFMGGLQPCTEQKTYSSGINSGDIDPSNLRKSVSPAIENLLCS